MTIIYRKVIRLNLMQILASIYIISLFGGMITISIGTIMLQNTNANAVIKSTCHPSLWRHVYSDTRLVPREDVLRAKYDTLVKKANNEQGQSKVQTLAEAYKLKSINCVTIRGTIYGEKAENDGDTHLVIQLDKADLNKHYLTEGNKKVCTTGTHIPPCNLMVAEAVCQNKILFPKLKIQEACKPIQGTYLKKIWGVTNTPHGGVPSPHSLLPPKLTHVCISGSNVIDKSHGWAEIHPISNIYKC